MTVYKQLQTTTNDCKYLLTQPIFHTQEYKIFNKHAGFQKIKYFLKVGISSKKAPKHNTQITNNTQLQNIK